MSKYQLLNVQDMNNIDNLSAKNGIPSLDLMENAGKEVVDSIITQFNKRPVSILCGPGKNGGDGFVVARLLKNKGWPIRLGTNKLKLSGDSLIKAELLQHNIESLNLSLLDECPLVIDAMFGSGLKRKLNGIPLNLVQRINKKKLACIAIDIPSGVNSDTGEIHGDAPNCILTITFFRAKPGHYLLPGKKFAGRLIIKNIGIPNQLLENIKTKTFLNNPKLWVRKLPKPTFETHKYTRGHLLISGAKNMTGAPQLAAIGARRIGAGLVTIAAPKKSINVYKTGSFGNLITQIDSLEEWGSIVNDQNKTAILIGPGLEKTILTQKSVLIAINSLKPVILDASAISAFEGKTSKLINLTNEKHILTPHEAEFNRLFKSKGNALKRARIAAKQCNAIILLKGSSTIIAHPLGNAVINNTGTPYLATAGSGDVLAGIIAGLISQGMSPFDAGCAGAWIHGQAAENFGPGLIAEDIVHLIPKILDDLLSDRHF